MQETHSEFRYLYRDASNHKAYGSVVLRGYSTAEDVVSLIKTLEGGQFFVAEQVGVPVLHKQLAELSGGVTPDDHAWHTFESLEPIDRGLRTAVWGTVEELVERFVAVRLWEINLSELYS